MHKVSRVILFFYHLALYIIFVLLSISIANNSLLVAIVKADRVRFNHIFPLLKYRVLSIFTHTIFKPTSIHLTLFIVNHIHTRSNVNISIFHIRLVVKCYLVFFYIKNNTIFSLISYHIFQCAVSMLFNRIFNSYRILFLFRLYRFFSPATQLFLDTIVFNGIAHC